MASDLSPYGVLYSVNADPNQNASKPTALDDLLTPSVKFVRIQWIDLINTVRFRVLPASHFRRLLADPAASRPGISISKVALGLVGLMCAPGFGAVGEYLYVPDLGSWRVCTYAPGHASVMGWFEEKAPQSPTAGLARVPLCPRAILDRLVREAHDKAGVSFLVGAEVEFILLSATHPEPVYVNDADWSCSAKTRAGSIEARVLEEIAECLLDAGIELQMYHAEAAPGQYEVITGPLAPLEAADVLVFTRETIYNIANTHGLKATFSPRLHSDSTGNGAHTHISVHKHGCPNNLPRVDPDPVTDSDADAARAPTLTRTERSFLSGLLAHLPALCALTLPTAASYARMRDGIWSGGTYPAWGTDNRETPVRLCGPPGHAHFEVKCVDGTATPHLAFAGIVGAGLSGILEGALLGVGDCRKPVCEMSQAERREVGLENVGRLPGTIVDARKALAADGVMRSVLGDEFVERYLGVNETLEIFLAGHGEKDTFRKLVKCF